MGSLAGENARVKWQWQKTGPQDPPAQPFRPIPATQAIEAEVKSQPPEARVLPPGVEFYKNGNPVARVNSGEMADKIIKQDEDMLKHFDACREGG